ncbi:MAG: hypothetical protein AB7P69_03175 [Candidatus Binatia bacterium]
MLVFQAMLSAGSGDQRTVWRLSGDVTPYNLEALYAYALERATGKSTSSRLREVKVTLTGTQKESVLPEISRRLQRLEDQGVKVTVT